MDLLLLTLLLHDMLYTRSRILRGILLRLGAQRLLLMSSNALALSCSLLPPRPRLIAHAHLVPARKRQSRRSWTTKISARCVHVFTTSMSCCARVGTAPVVRSRPLARVGTACGATFKCSPRVCRAPLHTSEGTSVTSSPLATARTWTPSAPYQDRRTGHADGNEGSAAKWQMGWGKAHET